MSLKADAEPNNNVSIEEEASAQLFVISFSFPFTHSLLLLRTDRAVCALYQHGRVSLELGVKLKKKLKTFLLFLAVVSKEAAGMTKKERTA